MRFSRQGHRFTLLENGREDGKASAGDGSAHLASIASTYTIPRKPSQEGLRPF